MKKYLYSVLAVIGFFANIFAAVNITSLDVFDSLEAARTKFASTESMGMKINAYNSAEESTIDFYFYVYDPNNTKVFSHTGNSASGKTGSAYSLIKNIPISFYTMPGIYRFEGKVTAGSNVDTASKNVEIYSPQITLSYPPNGVKELSDKPIVFRWISSGASKYRIQVDDENGFRSPVIWSSEGSAEFAEYPLYPADTRQNLAGGTLYWWKVDGYDAAGNLTASCSLPFSFTVKKTAAAVDARDMAVTDLVLIPGADLISATMEIVVKNQGGQIEMNVPVNLFVSGLQILPDKRVDAIMPGEAKTIKYTFVPVTAGLNLVSGSVVMHDDNPKNNIYSKTFDFSFKTSEMSSLSGMVRDESKNGISMATVYYSGITSGDILTDAGGGYTITGIPPGKYTIYSAKPGYGESEVRVAKVKKGIDEFKFDFTLKKPVDPKCVHLEGRVTDSVNKMNVYNAVVKYRNRSGNTGEVKTGFMGDYSIENIEPGAYYLMVEHDDYISASEKKVSAATGGESYLADFTLKPRLDIELGGIEVAVRAENTGKNIAGVRIICMKGKEVIGDKVNTGEPCKFDGLGAGKYKIILELADYVSVTEELKLQKGQNYTLTVEMQQLENFTGSEIKGLVKTKDGNGIPDAVVSYSGTTEGSVKSDSKGIYLITNLAQGTYKIEVAHPNYEKSGEIKKKLELNKGITCDFTLKSLPFDFAALWKKLKDLLRDWDGIEELEKYVLTGVVVRPPAEHSALLEELENNNYTLKSVEITIEE